MNIIPYDSDDAAKYVTNISGWVSSKGHFYGEKEDLARYDGCTHRACENCGTLAEKSYTLCPLCRLEKDIDRYFKLVPLTEQEWINKSGVKDVVVYSELLDEYFFDLTIEEILEQYELDAMCDLRLVWCEPQYVSHIDADAIWCDDLPEDGEVPSEIWDAVQQLNETIDEYNKTHVLGYYPSKFRVIEQHE